MVQQGTFQADLFHRLNILAIHIPPLRERPADVKALIEHFLVKNRFLKPTGPLSADADFIAALTHVELPGNARQLENLVRRALVNKDDDTALTLRDLPPDIWQQLSEQWTRPPRSVTTSKWRDRTSRSLRQTHRNRRWPPQLRTYWTVTAGTSRNRCSTAKSYYSRLHCTERMAINRTRLSCLGSPAASTTSCTNPNSLVNTACPSPVCRRME